ncbi:hypothetical protein Rhopal_003404-T1 [Rhodotorula paludigena]|uniref:Pre-mRNA-processing factor 19 n=1 Tax=Rhodotorula paludigena TaxID=86838 RepID=A0AAV5GJH7_9BASI|nr:hypothetical protein Rhopal_003404-T1 [Rhodotorula paludigena]
MSLFCSISGTQPLHPVVSVKSGHVFERDLILKYLADNEGKDPISGEQLAQDELVDIKTAPAQPTAPPRAPTFTSVPSLLHTLQQEWDATMLECLELRRQSAELRQELSHALYKEDAAGRVLARVMRERDEAREALASVTATLGPDALARSGAPAAQAEGDAQMEGVEQAEAGLPADARKRVEETNQTLSATRRKRKVPSEAATVDQVKAFVEADKLTSMHTTKPPGVSALSLVKEGSIVVTGGLDKNVIVYDRSSGKITATLKGHSKKVTSVVASTALTEEGLPSFVVSSSLDKSVRVWTPNGKKTVYDCSSNLSLGAEVRQLVLHPSNSLALSVQADGTWAIHDLVGDKASTVLTGTLPSDEHTADPSSIVNTAIDVHPDGVIFAVGSSDSRIRIFETLTGKCAATFEGHSAEEGASDVVSLSFSENGYSLASAASGSSTVKLWDLRKLSNAANIALGGDGASASAVRFDPTAQFLAVVGSDARVYQNKTWELLAQNDDNQAELTAVAWGKDSKELVTAGIDRTVRFLSTPSE